MKIRSGFVSNSSSSSFCIYGACIETSKLESLLNKLDIKLEYDYDEDYLYTIEKIAEKIGLDAYGYDDFGYFVGLSLTQMEMDETMRQFQKKIDDKLKLIGIDGGDIYEEAWRDG
jgi:hypothetical protein